MGTRIYQCVINLSLFAQSTMLLKLPTSISGSTIRTQLSRQQCVPFTFPRPIKYFFQFGRNFTSIKHLLFIANQAPDFLKYEIASPSCTCVQYVRKCSFESQTD